MHYPTIEEIMSTDIVYIERHDTLAHAEELISQKGIRNLIVKAGAPGEPGILSVNDIVSYRVDGISPETAVGRLEIQSLPTIHRTTNILEATMVFGEENSIVGVVDDAHRILGIATYSDILGVAYDRYETSLTAAVKNFITSTPVSVEKDQHVSAILPLMKNSPADCVIVTDQDKPIGIITKRDIVNLFSKNSDMDHTLDHVMSFPLVSFNLDTPLKNILGDMRKHRFKRIIITDDKHRLYGVVTQKEILDTIYSSITKKSFLTIDRINHILNQQIKKKTKKLHDMKERYALAIEGANDGLWDWDIQNDSVYLSPRWKEILGFGAEELPDARATLFDFIYDEDRHAFETHLDQHLKQGIEYFEMEHRIVTKQKEVRWVLNKARALFDTDGNPIRMVGYQSDIHKKKETEESLKSLNAALEDRVQQEVRKRRRQEEQNIQNARLASLGDMLQNISHHWRQPLSAIALNIQDIYDAYEYNELDQAYLLQFKNDSMKIINDLSETIETFKRLFKSKDQEQYFDVIPSITGVVRLLSKGLEENNIRSEFLCSCDQQGISTSDMEVIGSCTDCSIRLFGHETEFKQIIISLINNAKEAIFEAVKNKELLPDEGKIALSIQSSGEHLQLSIRDNGTGIPESIGEKVFEPYFTTKSYAKVQGLNLYMSKTIIEKYMNGTLSFVSAEGTTEFLLSLPLQGGPSLS